VREPHTRQAVGRPGRGLESPWARWIFLAGWLLFLFPIYWGSAWIGTIFYLGLLIPVVVLWLVVNRRLRRHRESEAGVRDSLSE
jgi:Flp pilus assembly protein TadB